MEYLIALILLGLAISFTYDALAVLRASGSQGVGNETGTGVEVGPTGLVKAVVHATVVGGTLAVHLEGSSALAGTYYDIPGGAFLNPTDGATIDAAGKYEIYIKTDHKFIRTYSTVASSAATWECFLSTAEK